MSDSIMDAAVKRFARHMSEYMRQQAEVLRSDDSLVAVRLTLLEVSKAMLRAAKDWDDVNQEPLEDLDIQIGGPGMTIEEIRQRYPEQAQLVDKMLAGRATDPEIPPCPPCPTCSHLHRLGTCALCGCVIGWTL